MIVCKHKKTGRIIESQSHSRPGTLIKNAVNAGHSADDVYEIEMSAEKLTAEIAEQNARDIPKTSPAQTLERVTGLSIEQIKALLK